MSKTVAALAALLVGVASATAQITGPAEAKIKAGRLGTIIVNVDADETAYKLEGDTFDAFREFDDVGSKRLRIRVLGYDPGVGYLTVAGIKGGKLLPLYTCKITIGDGPAPGPVPPVPVPPTPPVPPLDPLAKSIRDAAKADNASPAVLQTIADGFRSAVILSSRATTAQQLQDVASLKTAVGTLPPTVKGVLNGELRALDATIPPDKPDAELTGEQRTTAKTLFLKLATACEGAK